MELALLKEMQDTHSQYQELGHHHQIAVSGIYT
jgi:hypothetical protein